MAIWDDVLTGADREVYEVYAGKRELGKKPAVVVIDVNYAFVGLKSEPILESIKTYRTSCGEIGWEAMAHIQRLLALARALGIPVFYSTLVTNAMRGAAWANRGRNPELLDLVSGQVALEG